MNKYPFQDASLTIDKRVKDLMGRMTLNQKMRQLTGLLLTSEGEINNKMLEDGIGEAIYFSTLNSPKESAEKIRSLQKSIMEQTELGIPALFYTEALSGIVMPGCALFPTSIGLGASFAPDLVKDMADRIRKQLINIGVRQALSPVLDLARDFRWGRTGENYGSDPTLVSAMACAFVSGLQGSNLNNGVAATAKHFLGYSMTEGGLNQTRTQTDWRDLRENFAKPFEAAIRKTNLKAVMNSYSEYNGKPICASKEILTDLLRDDLGFDGLVISDYMSIMRLVNTFKTAENSTDAGIQSIMAGLDVELPTPYGYGVSLREAVKERKVDESYINRAVGRVLKLKFELGLFEQPYRDFQEINNTEHDIQSAYVSDKLMTLTKNAGILPLRDKNISIAVIGPTGNNLCMMNGSYTYPTNYEMMLDIMNTGKKGIQGVEVDVIQMLTDDSKSKREWISEVDKVIRKEHPGSKTIFEGLKEIYPNTSYVQGCHVKRRNEIDFNTAIDAASKADIVIMTVGGKMGMVSDSTGGEGFDNVDITLPGAQSELVQKVFAVNNNMIVVHTDNKPLIDSFIYENVPAVLEGWLPGPFGGNAIARAIAGITNPGGKLPVDIPRHVGQTPVYFYQHNGSRSDAGMHNNINPKGYLTESCSSQLPFGFGLSYTEFEYSNGKLDVELIYEMPHLTVSIDVKNVGGVAGDEVVQLYGIDEFASIIRPQKELIGFRRISLKAGQVKRVSLTFCIDQLAFQNSENQWIVEKGRFRFYIGKGSNDTVYEVEYKQKITIYTDHTKRGFFAETKEI
ncbi:beta-glucosidase [Bacillus cereus]|uniref:beta-glucosidase n=1 Tax=Bacillus cereus TaxID=1396 RepID=UPI000BF59C76|nr:glycoside hydrolase family 3 N-terminal domain-containing protein [Bacillus cereus]PFA20172.1 beta-glucosidase [Bacillus cereus]PGZ15176.1 beta-glucosidase [Bacillus cereus]